MSVKIRQPERTTAASAALGSRLEPQATSSRAPGSGAGARSPPLQERRSRAPPRAPKRLEVGVFCGEESSRGGEEAGRFRVVAAAELPVSPAPWRDFLSCSSPALRGREALRGGVLVSSAPRALVGSRASAEAGPARGVAGSTALAIERGDKNGEARRDALSALERQKGHPSGLHRWVQHEPVSGALAGDDSWCPRGHRGRGRQGPSSGDSAGLLVQRPAGRLTWGSSAWRASGPWR
jgi:hypothetical protein